MAERAQVIVIVALSVVTAICLALVFFLFRWLRKVNRANTNVDQEAFPQGFRVETVRAWIPDSPRKSLKDGNNKNVVQNSWFQKDLDEFEDKDWENMMLPVPDSPKRVSKPSSFMFEVEVISNFAGGRRAKRTVYMPHVKNSSDLGLVISGSCPVSVHLVEQESPSAKAGIVSGDEIVAIGKQPCSHLNHHDVVRLFSKVISSAKRKSSDQEFFGFPSNRVSEDTESISSIPGQIDTEKDSFEPIREAAARHQSEAASLIKAERFKEARVLLDKALDLIGKVPQSGSRVSHKFTKDRRSISKQVSKNLGTELPHTLFRSLDNTKKLKIYNGPLAAPRHVYLGTRRPIKIVTSLDQLPEIGIIPINRYKLSKRASREMVADTHMT
eukprot:m.65684 g.65684  ORF g.65684 m.65684 type:complete len:384 (+) comp11751_c0_seq2:111-1262(+)